MKAYCADVDTLNTRHVTAQYRVRAYNAMGWGAYSDVLQVDRGAYSSDVNPLPLPPEVGVSLRISAAWSLLKRRGVGN